MEKAIEVSLRKECYWSTVSHHVEAMQIPRVAVCRGFSSYQSAGAMIRNTHIHHLHHITRYPIGAGLYLADTCWAEPWHRGEPVRKKRMHSNPRLAKGKSTSRARFLHQDKRMDEKSLPCVHLSRVCGCRGIVS